MSMNGPAVILLNGVAIIVASGLLFYLFNEAQQNFIPQQTNRTIIDPDGPVVQFLLFTRKTVRTPQYLLPIHDRTINESNFDNNHPVKIIIHGFLSSVNDQIFYLIKNAYLLEGDYNIIGVDWSRLCSKDYLSAIKGTYVAAEQVSGLINWLSASRNIKLANIHIIGHSLGAHVAGLSADKIEVKEQIGRITGLDPAGPGFKEAPEYARLDPGDAKLIDSIHTSTQVLAIIHPVGHLDFYPNGGKAQPGCPDLLQNPIDNQNCNHGRAYLLFVESITNKKAFKSYKCANVEEAIVSRCLVETDVYMGQVETYKYGIYYFKTRATMPFSYP